MEWNDVPLGRLREIRICLGMFDLGVCVVVGPFEDLWAFRAAKHNIEIEDATCPGNPLGTTLYSHGRAPIIWIPRAPETPREFGTLAHEALHAIHFIMQETLGMPLTDETNEVYAHGVGFIVTQVLAELAAPALQQRKKIR
jgi:hypothetical protein